MKKFSDFNKEQVLFGPKVSIQELIDKEIEVLSYKAIKTKFSSSCMQIQFRYAGKEETFVTFTSSKVIFRQLVSYQHELPFSATVRKVTAKDGNTFFTFS